MPKRPSSKKDALSRLSESMSSILFCKDSMKDKHPAQHAYKKIKPDPIKLFSQFRPVDLNIDNNVAVSDTKTSKPRPVFKKWTAPLKKKTEDEDTSECISEENKLVYANIKMDLPRCFNSTRSNLQDWKNLNLKPTNTEFRSLNTNPNTDCNPFDKEESTSKNHVKYCESNIDRSVTDLTDRSGKCFEKGSNVSRQDSQIKKKTGTSINTSYSLTENSNASNLDDDIEVLYERISRTKTNLCSEKENISDVTQNTNYSKSNQSKELSSIHESNNNTTIHSLLDKSFETFNEVNNKLNDKFKDDSLTFNIEQDLQMLLTPVELPQQVPNTDAISTQLLLQDLLTQQKPCCSPENNFIQHINTHQKLHEEKETSSNISPFYSSSNREHTDKQKRETGTSINTSYSLTENSVATNLDDDVEIIHEKEKKTRKRNDQSQNFKVIQAVESTAIPTECKKQEKYADLIECSDEFDVPMPQEIMIENENKEATSTEITKEELENIADNGNNYNRLVHNISTGNVIEKKNSAESTQKENAPPPLLPPTLDWIKKNNETKQKLQSIVQELSDINSYLVDLRKQLWPKQ